MVIPSKACNFIGFDPSELLGKIGQSDCKTEHDLDVEPQLAGKPKKDDQSLWKLMMCICFMIFDSCFQDVLPPNKMIVALRFPFPSIKSGHEIKNSCIVDLCEHTQIQCLTMVKNMFLLNYSMLFEHRSTSVGSTPKYFLVRSRYPMISYHIPMMVAHISPGLPLVV